MTEPVDPIDLWDPVGREPDDEYRDEDPEDDEYEYPEDDANEGWPALALLTGGAS